MHLIKEIEISNFRSCKKTKILLENFTPLVGYNNAGKSNILKAIYLLVKAKGLDKEYFNDPEKPVEIIALLEGISDEVMSHLSDTQKASLRPYIKENAISIRFYQEQPGTSKNAVALTVKAPNKEADKWDKLNGIQKIISKLFPEPTFINSMEDAAEDVSKFKAGNTIGKLISHLQEEIIKAQGDEISEALKNIGKKFNIDGEERLAEFSDFDQAINEKIGDFFPGLKLNVHIPTPDITDLFKKGIIQVTENESPRSRDFKDMGHGAQRAIQMTLIRHLAEITKDVSIEGKTNLLLIDEPELFLHPQAIEQIRASLKTLANKGYQIVFSTHSPFMIEHQDIPITNIIRKDDNGTRAETRLKEAIEEVLSDQESQARLLFDTHNLSQILFSDTVLIAEGDTEKHVLPSLFHAISNKTMGEAKLALIIATGSANIPGMLKILKQMNIPSKALVDLDFAFTVANQQNFITDNHPAVNKCLDILIKIQPDHDFKLQGGIPRKNEKYKASEVYELLAKEADADEPINVLHNELKTNYHIWLWSSGAIEPHLCLETKQSGEWFKFKEKLVNNSIEDVVEDVEHITEFINWCQS